MNRREFILGGFGAAAMAGCRCSLCGGSDVRLAMAGYTLHRFKTDEALAFCEKHGFRYLCVKDMHLPLSAKPAEIAAFRRKCADHGVTPYGVGPIYMYTEDEAKRSFDYDAIFAALREIGYDGCVGLELANAFPDNVQWIDESRDYFEGLIG